MVDSGRRAASRCETCHARPTPPSRPCTRGRAGGHRAPSRPDVRGPRGCRSCHTDSARAAAAAGPRLAAIARACTSCHGARFAHMLPRWSEAMAGHAGSPAPIVAAARADARLAIAPRRRECCNLRARTSRSSSTGADCTTCWVRTRCCGGDAGRAERVSRGRPRGAAAARARAGSGRRRVRLLPLRRGDRARHDLRPDVRPRGPRAARGHGVHRPATPRPSSSWPPPARSTPAMGGRP